MNPTHGLEVQPISNAKRMGSGMNQPMCNNPILAIQTVHFLSSTKDKQTWQHPSTAGLLSFSMDEKKWKGQKERKWTPTYHYAWLEQIDVYAAIAFFILQPQIWDI